MRRLFWPALTTVLMLMLGIGLGVWQLERLAWKRALLAEIDRGEQTQPQPLGDTPTAFRRVLVRGEFLPLVARYGAEVRSAAGGAVMGAHVVTPLRLADQSIVMVDRGWAPMDYDVPPPSGQVDLQGYVRPAEKPVRFGATDDPAARRFYALDPRAIAASLGLGQVADITIVLLGPQGQLPEPAAALPRPPNNHLSYALTWFAMSFGLLVIFLLYARQALRPAADQRAAPPVR